MEFDFYFIRGIVLNCILIQMIQKSWADETPVFQNRNED